MVNRKIAPSILDAVKFDLKLQPFEKYLLKNGTELYTIRAGTEEVIMVEWVFSAGNWFESKNLQAAVTNHLLKNGTSSKSAYDINEHFEYYGSYFTVTCHAETASLTLHCLSRHISELLPVVHEIITDSVFPQGEIDIAIQNLKQKLEVNLKKSSFVAGRLIDSYLFGSEHPYGRYSRLEDFDALSREDLVGFYQQYYLQGHTTIFIAGNFPPGIQVLMDQYFGDLTNGAIVPGIMSIHPSAERKYRIINDENGSQGSIRLARPFGNRHHPDFKKVQVLNVLFGGFFGSRLMANIREDKGYTYGIHSYLMPNIRDNGWVITTEAGRDVCEATLEEVYREMKILREEPVEKDELELVQNFMMGSILSDLDGPFHIISRWKTSVLNNLPDDHFDQTIRSIKEITSTDIQEMANKYLVPEDFYELIVI